MNPISLKNYGQYETERLNTPLSIEACNREGIKPEDLIYYPLESFASYNTPKQIQKINFDFYENQRKKLLKIAMSQYKDLSRNIHIRTHSYKAMNIDYVVNTEVYKLKEKKKKYISKLASYKLENLKSNLKASKSAENFFPNTENSFKRTFGNSSECQISMPSSPSVSKKNIEKDALLIHEEKLRSQKLFESEKQRILDSDKRRKAGEVKIAEHLKKVKTMREKECQEKVENYMKRKELYDQKLNSLFQRRLENQQEKIAQGHEKKSLVHSMKSLYEKEKQKEKAIFFKKEKKKIEHHIEKKNQNQKNLVETLKEKNSKHDVKSMHTRERIEEEIEGKKRKTLNDFKRMCKKLEYLKEESKKSQEIVKQKNKLREVEKNWNSDRAIRKEEYLKSEILGEIKVADLRMQDLEIANNLIQHHRHDLTVQTSARKDQMNKELYFMEVKKKCDVKKINCILGDEGFEGELSLSSK